MNEIAIDQFYGNVCGKAYRKLTKEDPRTIKSWLELKFRLIAFARRNPPILAKIEKEGREFTVGSSSEYYCYVVLLFAAGEGYAAHKLATDIEFWHNAGYTLDSATREILATIFTL